LGRKNSSAQIFSTTHSNNLEEGEGGRKGAQWGRKNQGKFESKRRVKKKGPVCKTK